MIAEISDMPSKLAAFHALWQCHQQLSNALCDHSLHASVLAMHIEHEWTHSDLKTPIALYASHPPAQLKRLKPILLMGGIHGDEPLGVELAKKTLEFLEHDSKKPQPEITVPWALIPILNVDGFKAGTRVNGRGVDLNRNYPSMSWTSGFEKERYNPGPAAASEAEIKAVVGFIQDFKPRLIIHCHSWKPMVVAAGDPGMRDAERLSRSSGYKVVPEIGYPTPGSLSQFGWVDNQIPVICIEEDDDTPREQVWAHFQAGIREIFLDASPR
jgi:murein peptide amidase A